MNPSLRVRPPSRIGICRWLKPGENGSSSLPVGTSQSPPLPERPYRCTPGDEMTGGWSGAVKPGRSRTDTTGRWRNGKRASLLKRSPQGHAGSTPVLSSKVRIIRRSEGAVFGVLR